jgi:hypothetical protein
MYFVKVVAQEHIVTREHNKLFHTGIEELKMSNWISVKDRLPEKGISIMACAKYRITPERDFSYSMYVAWIENFGRENKPIWQYSWCCGCFCGEDITHWMPLPEPPKD